MHADADQDGRKDRGRTARLSRADDARTKSMNPRSMLTPDEPHAQAIADVEARLRAVISFPSIGGSATRTNVPLFDAPVTIASNVSPMRDCTTIAAADFRTCRSTLFAASSCCVQCVASCSSSPSAVRRRMARERRLDEPLRHEIRIAPVRRRRVRVVAHGEAEMPRRLRARRIDDVLAAAEQADDAASRDRETSSGSACLRRVEKRRQRERVGVGRQLVAESAPPASRMRSQRSGDFTTRRSDGNPRASRNRAIDAVGRDHQVLDERLRAVRRLRPHVVQRVAVEHGLDLDRLELERAVLRARSAFERLRDAILHPQLLVHARHAPPRPAAAARRRPATRRRRCRPAWPGCAPIAP